MRRAGTRVGARAQLGALTGTALGALASQRVGTRRGAIAGMRATGSAAC